MYFTFGPGIRQAYCRLQLNRDWRRARSPRSPTERHCTDDKLMFRFMNVRKECLCDAVSKDSKLKSFLSADYSLSSRVSEPLHRLADLLLVLHAHRNRLTGVQHGSVMSAAESLPNFVQGDFGVLPSKIHGHLAREDNIRVASFTSHVREPNAKMFGHLLLNPLDSERLFGVFPQNIPQQLLYRFSGTLSLVQ